MECPEAAEVIKEGDVVSIDADTGAIVDETTKKHFMAQPFPAFIKDIIEDGGLVEHTKCELTHTNNAAGGQRNCSGE